MNGYRRTIDFIEGNKPVRPPFHPIIMRWAASYARVDYRDFCLNWRTKVGAMIKCAEDFGLDWVTVMSDPYAEAEAFGLSVAYPPDSLPQGSGYLLEDIAAVDELRVPDFETSTRMVNRVQEVAGYRRQCGERYLIVGWVEGAVAEYADLRGLTNLCLDLYDYPEVVDKALRIINENAKNLIARQLAAGAHCIGIGDAACSQIGPQMYRRFAFARERELVEHIHQLGGLAKIHICGDTTAILPDIIKTGADIIDIDHLVSEITPLVSQLGPHQVFSGNSDPVTVIKNGTAAEIRSSVNDCYDRGRHRVITSAGCEIPPETSVANFQAYADAALALAVGRD